MGKKGMNYVLKKMKKDIYIYIYSCLRMEGLEDAPVSAFEEHVAYVQRESRHYTQVQPADPRPKLIGLLQLSNMNFPGCSICF